MFVCFFFSYILKIGLTENVRVADFSGWYLYVGWWLLERR